jgi:hypothetical protein
MKQKKKKKKEREEQYVQECIQEKDLSHWSKVDEETAVKS